MEDSKPQKTTPKSQPLTSLIKNITRSGSPVQEVKKTDDKRTQSNTDTKSNAIKPDPQYSRFLNISFYFFSLVGWK